MRYLRGTGRRDAATSSERGRVPWERRRIASSLLLSPRRLQPREARDREEYMSSPLSLTAASLTRPAHRVKRERHVEWRRVRSLLEAVGTVVKEDGGRLRVTLGGETGT